jgi:RNA polymerase sigma factor (sigma-70 family)
MEPSDAELWARSRAGNGDAFGTLFDRHAKLVYNYCFRRIGNWASAEDMLSLVFLEAWRRRDKELPSDKILPWLFGIATNVVRNERRSERRFTIALSRTPTIAPEPDFAGDANERLDDERQAEAALMLLGKLSRREQDVFFLSAVMELSYEDTASALGLPIGTVRSRLSRAQARLRNSIQAVGHEKSESPATEAHEP